MTADPRDLRRQAASMRRAADRFTLLRLRLATTIAEVGRSADPVVRRIGAETHDHWIGTEYAQLGRIAGGLRSGARHLEDTATSAERTSGRRLGGYAGAGFLGRGDEAPAHVGEVAQFVGTAAGTATQHGASIGGLPLEPAAGDSVLTHPSHTLGIETPDYDDERTEDG